jgi:hypothetical protein
MTFFHGHTPASGADVFHGSQFVFAHVGGIDGGRSAEAALGFVTAWTAQMSGLFSHGAASLTGIGHFFPPVLKDA